MVIRAHTVSECYNPDKTPTHKIVMNDRIEATIYQTYDKPFFAPPDWIFGPVWTVLYITIAIGFIAIARQVFLRRLPSFFMVLLGVNLMANFLFTPIQFGLQNLWLAWIDILIVLISLGWIEFKLWKKEARWIFWILLPYMLWVSFATVLQTSITLLNR